MRGAIGPAISIDGASPFFALTLSAITEDSRRISSHDSIGGHIACDHSSGTDNSSLANGNPRQEHNARADRRVSSHESRHDRPVALSLGPAFARRCPWL